MIKPSNFHLAIGLPCSFPMVPFPTVLSMLQMERPNYTLIPAVNGPVDGLRNHIVEQALMMGASNLIMMDLDQTYPVDTIPKLLAHKLPVVGCLVHRRYPPFDPLLYKGKLSEYERMVSFEDENIDYDYKDGDLVEVDATGTGCLMFDMKVFREMPGPWFKFRLTTDGRPVGEDFGFCSELRKMGTKIHVDTSIKCGHLSTMEVTEGTYNLFRAMTKAQNKEKANGL